MSGQEPLALRIFVGLTSALLVACFAALAGEVLPRRLGSAYPDRIASFLSPLLYVVVALCAPLVHFLTLFSSILCKLLRIPEVKRPAVTEEELLDLVEQGSESGTINETEVEIFSKVFRLEDKRTVSLMTPHKELVWLNIEQPVSELLEQAIESGYSHFPIARGSLEQTLGVVTLHDLARCVLNHHCQGIDEYISEGLRVPENVSALKVVELFRESQDDVGLVFDEHGTFKGLINSS